MASFKDFQIKIIDMSKCPLGKRFKKDFYVDKDAYEAMVIAKVTMLRFQPFWGSCALGLTMVEDTSGFIPTLTTDGRHIFYSAAFVKALPVPKNRERSELEFCVAHEIYHCLMLHCGPKESTRMGDRKYELYGIACDYVVNSELKEAQVGEFIKTIQIYYDEKYKGWSTEEVYEDLLKNPPKNGGEGALDKHIEIELVPDDGKEGKGDGDQDGNGNLQVDKDGKIRIKVTQQELDKLSDTWKDNLRRAASVQAEAAKQGLCAGLLPTGVQRMLDDLKAPVIDWRAALRRFVTQVKRRGYSYQNPNKALFNMNMTIPGYRKHQNRLDVAMVFDTSGSMSQEQITQAMSELLGMLKAFAEYNVLTWCFDGSVIESSVTKITRIANENPTKSLSRFVGKVAGGGGTNFEANWEWMRENGHQPRLLVFFTDGCPGSSWGDPKYCPVLWVISGNPGVKAPFGFTVHYEDAEQKRNRR